MAVLGKIRKRGVTLIIIIGLGLFAFIAEEAFRSCEAASNEQRQQVGEVLGEKISVQEFQELMDEYQEMMKVTQGRDNLSDYELNQVKDQVWQTYVSSALLRNEAERLGLTVTDEEMQNIMREGTHPMLLQTPFVNQQTGRFDAASLTKFLNDHKNLATSGLSADMIDQYNTLYRYWQFMEKTLRQQLLAEKYQALLAGCLLSNPVSAKLAADAQSTESDILLASMPYSTINDSKVEVAESDLKAKYDEQKDMYRQDAESRDIKYVTVQVTASDADRNALMATMREAQKSLEAGEDPTTVARKAQSQTPYTGIAVTRNALARDIAARIDSLQPGQTSQPFETASDNTLNVVKLISKTLLPDSVEFRMIQAGGETLEAARQRGDSIANALQAGADFETIAKTYGQTGAAQWLTSAMYERSLSIDSDTKQYLEALSTMPEGAVKNLQLSTGNLIVKVTARRALTDKYVAAVVKHTIDFSKDTYSKAYNRFSQYVSENQTVDALEKNAAKYGYRVETRADLFSNEHYVAGARNTRDAMKWIFEAKEGDVSPLYECGDNDRLLVVAMTKIHPVGFRSLADVNEEVKEQVVRDKKFEQLKGQLAGAKSVADAQKKGAKVDTVRQISFAAPAFIQATGASEPALSGAVAATEQGKFCPEVVKGNAGAYMFQVIKTGPRTASRPDEKTMERQLQQAAVQAAGRFISELYEKANVVDNRYLFF